MAYIDDYATIWVGICLGMAMAFGFSSLTYPMPRRWHTVAALLFFVCAFLVRPFVYSLVVTP